MKLLDYRMLGVVCIAVMLAVIIILEVAGKICEVIQNRKNGYSEPIQAIEGIQWLLLIISVFTLIGIGVA